MKITSSYGDSIPRSKNGAEKKATKILSDMNIDTSKYDVEIIDDGNERVIVEYDPNMSKKDVAKISDYTVNSNNTYITSKEITTPKYFAKAINAMNKVSKEYPNYSKVSFIAIPWLLIEYSGDESISDFLKTSSTAFKNKFDACLLKNIKGLSTDIETVIFPTTSDVKCILHSFLRGDETGLLEAFRDIDGQITDNRQRFIGLIRTAINDKNISLIEPDEVIKLHEMLKNKKPGDLYGDKDFIKELNAALGELVEVITDQQIRLQEIKNEADKKPHSFLGKVSEKVIDKTYDVIDEKRSSHRNRIRVDVDNKKEEKKMGKKKKSFNYNDRLSAIDIFGIDSGDGEMFLNDGNTSKKKKNKKGKSARYVKPDKKKKHKKGGLMNALRKPIEALVKTVIRFVTDFIELFRPEVSEKSKKKARKKVNKAFNEIVGSKKAKKKKSNLEVATE